MIEEEISLGLRNPYIKICSCGKEYTILAQRDNGPEYYTEIFLKCDCGNFIEFNLPVN